MQNKDIIILDSVCTTGGTIQAIYDLLLKTGIQPEQIIEATLLFTEGVDRTEISVSHGVNLKLHRFGYLPIVKKESEIQ